MKEKKESNQNSEVLFRTIADEAIMGIAAFELPDRKCIYINNIGREILEVGTDDPPDSIRLESLAPSQARENLRNFGEDIFAMEGLIRDVLMEKKNGIPFVADIGIKKKQHKGHEIFLLMFQDVTIQKKLQREITAKQHEIQKALEEMVEQNKQLKELDLAKDRFIALTTHELRTPLAAIVATAEVLNMKLYDTDEQRDEFIETVFDQGKHLMALVNDILDFAKIQAGKMEFYIEEQDFVPVIDLQMANFDQMAETSEIHLTYHRPDQPVICFFDQVRISEVVSNVLSNAIKFTPQGGKVDLSVIQKDDTVCLTIADTGKGIPPENVDKVFNEFETIGNIKTHHKGTGLGMPISKRIMNSLGGDIWLESEINKGTTFYIELPTQKILPEEMYKARADEVDDLLKTV